MMEHRQHSDSDRKDAKVQVVIKRKDTGEVVDRNTCYHDQARSWGDSRISGHRDELKWEIIQMT